MNTVKELNKLAEKMVGENPKSRLDAEAIKYIQDNYEGGGGTQSKYDYVIPAGLYENVVETSQVYGENVIAVLNEIDENYKEGWNIKPLKIGIHLRNSDIETIGFCDVFQLEESGGHAQLKILSHLGNEPVYIKIFYNDGWYYTQC